ncbi:MAG TPA: c-type cytochrome domain-containing protein [Bdellovibrionota bacterium]|nr:c-type cytochrome domain-containing protein [Bdellovibrionota bacterium]
MKKGTLFLFILLISIVVSCGFRIDKLAQNETTTGFTDQELNQPTFAVINQKIFQGKCMSCHGPSGSAKRVSLEPRDALLNSPLDLVIPENPDESGLAIAISRTDKKRMPPEKSGPPLSTTEIAIIKKWILQGAQ